MATIDKQDNTDTSAVAIPEQMAAIVQKGYGTPEVFHHEQVDRP